MTKRADTPTAYEDCKYVLEVALKKPGLLYHCEDHGKAIHFKQRCNSYRVLLRKIAQEVSDVPGFRPEISYDILIISQVNEDLKPDRKGTILQFHHQAPLGRLVDPETGEEISIDMGKELLQ